MVNNQARKQKRKAWKGSSLSNGKDKKSIPKETSSKRKANYRKDKDGSIILFGSIKISKMSWAVLGGILAVGLFLGIGSNEMFEMDEYIPPEFSFESCEAQDFTADMCKYHYKFCRTYADGKTICQFAESDPFVNVDADEMYYAPEDQDFLPPQFIMPLVQWADARGEGEPQCYTNACKKISPQEKSATDNSELTSEELNRIVMNLRKEISDIQIEISEVEKRIQEWTHDEITYRNDVDRAEKELEDTEEYFDDAETAYRHAFDIKPRTDEDIKLQEDALEEYKKASVELAKARQDYNNALEIQERETERYYDDKNDIVLLEDRLEELLKELTIARVDANRVHRTVQFVAIVLSDTCLTMIQNNMTTNCPTYTELRDMFDNTLPNISGDFVQGEYDIYREPSKYKNYWNFYKQIENWKIITVDPDIGMLRQSSVVVIQPSGFTYLENIETQQKSASYNATGHERYVWNDIKYSDNCRNVIVAPDMELITKAIGHFISGCKDIHEVKETIDVPKTPFNILDSMSVQYRTWLNNAILQCKGLC